MTQITTWCDYTRRLRYPGVRNQVSLSQVSITKNKASGGDGIPAELSQILKDDARNVLNSVCQQIWNIK